MTIPQSILQTALSMLESHVGHPATGAIHDPLYALMDGPSEVHEVALCAALDANPGHPVAADLRSLLADHMEMKVPDLVAVLTRHGPCAEDDPVAEVDRRLAQNNEVRRVLEARIAQLERAVDQIRRSANGVASIGAIVAVFALIGWSIALGFVDITWIEPATPSDPASAASGGGSPAPSERAVR